MSEKKTEARKYEGMFLLPAAASADNEGALRLVRGLIEKHGGSVLVAKKWDERKLAYEIGKHKRGLYVITYFNADPSAIAPMERDVKLSEEYIRMLVTDASHLSQEEMEAVEPQPIQPKEERAPWDRPYEGGGDRGGDRGNRDRGPRETANA